MREELYCKKVFKDPKRKWVVFIHGAGGNSKTWSRQVEAFTSKFNILLIDLRDHGNSKSIQPEFQSYSFEIISKDIKLALDKAEITKAHFVTLSFGSVVMQDFAKRHPEVIDKAIFIGGIFKGSFAIKSFVYMAKAFNLILPYPTMYSLFSYLLMPRKRNQIARKLYRTQAMKITQSEYMKWIGLYREFFRLLKTFSNYPIINSSLIVMGSDDFVFKRSARQFASRHPNISFESIPQTGHIANIESADSFNKIGLNFLCQ